ncbi:CopG family ribbon-helix-helix protein [Azospirillum sp. sgz301742]
MADDTVMFGVDVPGDLATRFDAISDRLGRSRDWLIIKAVEVLVEADERREADVAEGFSQLDRGEDGAASVPARGAP